MRTYTLPSHAEADSIITPTGIKADLYTADEVRALPRGCGYDPLIDTVDWCEHFLCRPNDLVGRGGNVCPFVPEAMMRGSLRFALLPLRNRGQAAMGEIEGIVATFREYFLRREKTQHKIDIFCSMVMVFPDVSKEEATFVIDRCQRKLKTSFVRNGLMLGEFHPLSNTPGLRSRAFRPLRSPVPLLAIRHMVESDVDFLITPSDPAMIRAQSLRAYLHCLGSSIGSTSQRKATEALRLAEAESPQVAVSVEVAS
jgi:hypothetical protein